MRSVDLEETPFNGAKVVRVNLLFSPVSRGVRVMQWLLQPAILLRAIMLLIVALYFRTIAFDFVYDDLTLLTNPWMESWKSVPAIFTHDIFGFTGTHGPSVYYRPIPVLITLAVRQLTGGAPGMFHLLALILHLVIFYLAYLFGRLLLRDERLALFAALLYALHPSKVESVAWIGSSLVDATSGVFFFGTLICYLQWRQQHNRAWLAGSVLVFSAALLTKETMLVAPAIIAVHYWLTTEPVKRMQRLAAVLLPYGVALGGYLLVRHMVLISPAGTNYSSPSLTAVWSAPLACWWYIKHLLLPAGLSVVYDANVVTTPTLRTFYAPGLGLAIASALLLWLWFRQRLTIATVLGAWFILTLVPYVVMSLMVRQHDRYLYLAAYPFCALLAYLLLRAGSYKPWVRVVFASALLMFYAGSTWRETTVWDNSLALWTNASKIAPKAIEPRLELANAYGERRDVISALMVIDDGLRINPASPSLWLTRGLILYQNQQFSEAREAFLKVMNVGSGYKGRAISAFQLGVIEIADEQFSAAENWLRQAIALEPENSNYHRALANALTREGRAEEAQQHLSIATEIAKRTAARNF